ncbi:MAG TPA: hypothetical protein DCL44_06580 [Elusimicrobia bacterium]|nr:hypothetical protein [Elusimicrobiota bacterium]
MNANRILENITVASLEKCVGRLSKVSAGRWSLADVSVSRGVLSDMSFERRSGESGAAVYFEISGDCPFTAMIIFQAADIKPISKCFLGFAFKGLADANQSAQLLISELGNIILNSFIGSLSNALKRSFIPSAPKCLTGEPRFLLEALAAFLGKEQKYSLVSVMLDLQCDHIVTRAEVVGIIPEKLEAELKKSVGDGEKI